MRFARSLRRASAAALALAASSGALPAVAAEIRYRGKNLNLEEARSLVGKARYEEALEELQTAEQLPGNTNRHLADLFLLRASALLGLPPNAERTAQAKQALVSLFHVDPEGLGLPLSSDPVRRLAQQVRAERPLLLHDRLVTVRTGRPMRLRARVTGAQAASIFVRYRVEPELDASGNLPLASLGDPDEYVRVQLDPRGSDSFEAFLRPGVGGIPSDGEQVIRYYLEAFDSAGKLLDSNGTAQEPIRVQLSETRTEGAGVGGADVVLATLDEGGKMAHPPPPPPPPPPWYKRWEIVGPIGGALVIGGVIALVVLSPKPQPPGGSLGTVSLP